jgi:WD domain, G-beta repeat
MRTLRFLVAISLALLLLAPPATVLAVKFDGKKDKFDGKKEVTDVAVHLAKFAGEQLVKKGLDVLFASGGPPAKDRVKELDLRLGFYESSLRQVDAKMADQVASMRKELGTKTTAEDVRAIVKKTLGELDGRIRKLEAGADKLENRQDKVDARIKDIEDLFGYIPSVAPAPLLLSSVEAGEPKAHPLTLEWLKLLTRSEQSRQDLEQLRRTRPDTSKAVMEALTKDKALVAETTKLHGKVKEDLARRLADRQELLREFKQGSAKVHAFDEEMASVLWLTAVTRPIARGAHAGRLGVPPALFGPQASEMVLAFKLSKAEPSEVADLYRRHLLSEATSHSFLGVSLERGKLTKEMTKVGDEAVEAALKGFNLGWRVQYFEVRLQAALKDFSAESPQVKGARIAQAARMNDIRKLHQRFAELLKDGSKLYVEAMERERPTNARMTAFRDGVLLPLAAWSSMTRAQEEGHDQETRNRLSGYGWRVSTLNGHTSAVWNVAWSPDGKRLATASYDKTAKVWDAATGKEVFSLGHTSGVFSVAWSPDGKRLATASEDFTAKVWDAATGKEVFSLRGHTSNVMCVAWSPDGKRIASGSVDKTAKVWDAATGKEVLSLAGYIGSVSSVAWSPDGKRLAAGRSDWPQYVVKVWDAESGKEVLSLAGHTQEVKCVAWSPDGKRIASGSVDKTAKVWDAATGKEVLSIAGHTSWVMSVAWSPDGKRLATASYDKTAKVWDAETGKEVFTLRGGHTSDVFSVAWSPDGKRIATASLDKTAKVWPLAEAITRASRAK